MYPGDPPTGSQNDWVGYMGASCGGSQTRGVATLINKQLQFKCVKLRAEEAGRILLMLCEIQVNGIILANAPDIDDPAYPGLLEKKLNEMGDYVWCF